MPFKIALLIDLCEIAGTDTTNILKGIMPSILQNNVYKLGSKITIAQFLSKGEYSGKVAQYRNKGETMTN